MRKVLEINVTKNPRHSWDATELTEVAEILSLIAGRRSGYRVKLTSTGIGVYR